MADRFTVVAERDGRLRAACRRCGWRGADLPMAQFTAATAERDAHRCQDACQHCGCVDEAACLSGCTWAAVQHPSGGRLCSACVPLVDWPPVDGDVLDEILALAGDRLMGTPSGQVLIGSGAVLGIACELRHRRRLVSVPLDSLQVLIDACGPEMGIDLDAIETAREAAEEAIANAQVTPAHNRAYVRHDDPSAP